MVKWSVSLPLDRPSWVGILARGGLPSVWSEGAADRVVNAVVIKKIKLSSGGMYNFFFIVNFDISFCLVFLWLADVEVFVYPFNSTSQSVVTYVYYKKTHYFCVLSCVLSWREYETLLTQFSKELEKLQLRHQVGTGVPAGAFPVSPRLWPRKMGVLESRGVRSGNFQLNIMFHRSAGG